MSDSKRISWDAYALILAEAASLRSEDPYIKVGACALNAEHMVQGVGYNGLASGKRLDSSEFWEDRDKRRIYMIHAETNCLSLCKKGEVETLAVTLLPCSQCATMIAAYGIKRVVYGEEYSRDALAKEIFRFYGIELQKIEEKDYDELPEEGQKSLSDKKRVVVDDNFFSTKKGPE
jgi:dCMP deaminase